MFGILVRSIAVLTLSLALLGSAATLASAAEEHHDAGHAAEHHETGLPMDWSRDLALFSLVTFVVYVAVLRFGAWGPLRTGLNERERHIRQDIADAEANRIKSEAMIAEREAKLATVQDEVRELLAEARRDAERTKQDIITTAQNESEAMKQRAVAEIERSRDQALAELFDFVSNNVVGATERVIGRSLNQGDHDRLVGQALSEMNIRRN
jgi:F-type H+-transporting ATPase subunit b